MDKLTIAHEWAMNSFNAAFESEEERVKLAWQYADAMQAEAENREDKSRPDVLEEWQPDWDVAPDWANWWAQDLAGDGYWYAKEPIIKHDISEWTLFDGGCGADNIFDHSSMIMSYWGDWRNSLRKRP